MKKLAKVKSEISASRQALAICRNYFKRPRLGAYYDGRKDHVRMKLPIHLELYPGFNGTNIPKKLKKELEAIDGIITVEHLNRRDEMKSYGLSYPNTLVIRYKR